LFLALLVFKKKYIIICLPRLPNETSFLQLTLEGTQSAFGLDHVIHYNVVWCTQQMAWFLNGYCIPSMICGSLSPQHGASSGSGWRNGLPYGG